MFRLKSISLDEYNSLIEKKTLSYEEIYKIAQYPYISLVSYYGDSIFHDKIKSIEDKNVYYLLNTINLLFGLGDKREQEIFNSYLTKEPLRTAIFLAREEVNPKEQFASFIYYSCKILLSNGGKQGFLRDPIDVKINGKMPFLLCKSSQQIGDNWYKSFVENKLTVAKIALKHLNEEKAYAVILRSIAYSIYFFTPYLYNISNCIDEDEALRLILKTFIIKIKEL